MNKLTKTHSESASYEFTTLTCIPGVIEVLTVCLYDSDCHYFSPNTSSPPPLLQYNDANIQLLDLPGIIEGASQGLSMEGGLGLKKKKKHSDPEFKGHLINEALGTVENQTAAALTTVFKCLFTN